MPLYKCKISYKGAIELSKIKQINNYITNNELDLDRIVDDFTPYVKTIISNMANETLSYEDKEEILSDTFFILWKNRLNNIDFLDSYIAGIARNLVKEKFRKRKITYDISDYENIIGCDDIDLFAEKRNKVETVNKSLKNLNELDLKDSIIDLYKLEKDNYNYIENNVIKYNLFRNFLEDYSCE